MYHEKMGIIEDAVGDKTAFSGSNNESATAMSINYETMDVFRSWGDPSEVERVRLKENAFYSIWHDTEPNIFWFTLFHEIGHIINEDFEDKYIDYSIIDSEIERRADEFAKNRLINEDEYKAFMDAKTHEIKDVEEFAKAQKVIPSIVIGRMQRDLNDYSFLMKYKHKYVWG